MLNKVEKELVKKMFFYPVFIVVISFILVVFSSYYTLYTFKSKEVDKNTKILINNKKNYLKENVINLSKDIDNALQFSLEETKKNVKHRVYLIYYAIKSLYSLNKNKTFIINYLNTLNTYLKNHYIFAYDTNGIVKTHILKSFIGKNTKKIYLINHMSVFERNKKILNKNNEGFIKKYFYKPNNKNKKFLKIDFIKYIPELNLIIGSGEYVDEIKNKLEKQIFQRIMMKRYGNDYYFFIIKKDGTLILNPTYKSAIGKNILNLKDINGKYFIKEMIKKALENKNGSFVVYKWINPKTGKIEKKISYVLFNKSIDAIIGSGLYIQEDIAKNINDIKKNLNEEFKIFYRNLVIIFLIILIFSVFLSFILFRKLKNVFFIYDKLLKEEKKKIEYESLHDPLTKIANRRFFNQKIKEEILRAKRYNHTFSIAMVDIDYFKKINDTYGHDIGDLVLKKMASFIKRHIRSTDIFARWGGEEFMLIFPYTDLQKAKQICEKLKKELQENEFVQRPVKFTISCGITEFRKDNNIESIIKRADEALYEAKNGGRDRIVLK
ncbi:diguanylate cyclase [Lebetimonas natsushimae]|uniref:diguanylate cyclase n=1 Tax=Lebetimonas natsushimae TaxID=1936991 RepID=A0A292YE61_9BACT|nr:diguanylate cyclase [Lebetimonas natsushimae]GAX88167.1 diguanylate cyclase [Lebetimonas natsushimae]